MVPPFLPFCLVTVLITGEAFYVKENIETFYDDIDACLPISHIIDLQVLSAQGITGPVISTCGCVDKVTAIKHGLIEGQETNDRKRNKKSQSG